MNAQELRLGNLVYFTDIPFKVKEISNSFITCDRGRGDCDFSINNLKPIPLTAEWLERFGFEKWTWCNDAAFIPLFFGDSMYCRFYNDMWHIKRMKVERDSKGVYGKTQSKYILPKGNIKYVHQLQNLYFSLCSKELKYKL